MVGRDTEPHEAPGGRQPLDHVHLHRDVGIEQRTGCVEAGRTGPHDRNTERPAHQTMLVGRQAEQPEPQPPTAPSASAPSSTWKEWPQPQEELALGLLIANPAAWMEST